MVRAFWSARSAAHADPPATGEEDTRDADDGPYAFHPPLIRKVLGPPVITADSVARVFPVPQERRRGRAAASATQSAQNHALRDISLRRDSHLYPVRKGEFVMIRGPSGGGKTTLLNLFGALDKPSSGSLSVLGTTLTSELSDAEMSVLRLRRIGFVFQTFNLMSALSAAENVMLPMMLSESPATYALRLDKAKSLLLAVGLQDRLYHLPAELSGGEQQRVAIARALANDPELLLLDEPTGDLDTRNTVEVMNLLLSINQDRGTTCVMVTHNPDLECYADRVLYVQDGTFERQVINEEQARLDFAHYESYLKRTEQTAMQRET